MTKEEQARLSALRGLDLMRDQNDPVLNELVGLMAARFDVPIALISLVEEDFQWFKARHGVSADGTPREGFCGIAIGEASPLVVPDALLDARFRDLGLVREAPHIRFYAGAPLTSRNGYRIGTACLASPEPRIDFGEADIRELSAFARIASLHIELQYDKRFRSPVTGLPNRLGFERELERRIAAPADGAGKLAVIVADAVSHHVYDGVFGILGPASADHLIREAGQALAGALKDEEKAFHLSARRFGIVTRTDAVGRTEENQRRILDALRRTVPIDGIDLVPDPTLGFAILPDHAGDARGLIQAAVAGLRFAHRNRRDSAGFDQGEDVMDRRAFGLATELRKLPRQESQLAFHLQPVIDLESGRCVAAELLARWTHPRLGVIPPTEFIPVAEQFGTIGWITGRALDTALHYLQTLKRHGHAIRVSFNVSASDICAAAFADEVRRKVEQAQIAPSALEIEITESAIIRNGEAARQNLKALREFGVGITVDDYGTAHSNLAYLRDFPLDKLKIDQSFIQGLGEEQVNEIIVRSTVALARQLNLTVCGEGVETASAERHMKFLGISLAQGYLHGQAMSFADFETWLGQSASEPARAHA